MHIFYTILLKISEFYSEEQSVHKFPEQIALHKALLHKIWPNFRPKSCQISTGNPLKFLLGKIYLNFDPYIISARPPSTHTSIYTHTR